MPKIQRIPDSYYLKRYGKALADLIVYMKKGTLPHNFAVEFPTGTDAYIFKMAFYEARTTLLESELMDEYQNMLSYTIKQQKRGYKRIIQFNKLDLGKAVKPLEQALRNLENQS